MELPRRKFLNLAAGAAAVLAVSSRTWAQTYPSHSVRLIVPFPPGGPNDVFARLIGQWLHERLGQPIHHRQQTGRRWEYWNRSGREGCAGRLYPPLDQFEPHGQRNALRQTQLQFHSRHRACCGHHSTAARLGAESTSSSEDPSGIHQPMRRPILANSTTRRSAMAAHLTWPANCSR